MREQRARHARLLVRRRLLRASLRAALILLPPLVTSLAATATAFAEERDDRTTVLLVLAGNAEERAAFEASLRELSGRLGLRLRVRTEEHVDLTDRGALARESPALASVWVDLTGEGRAMTVLVEGRTGRIVLEREVTRDRSSAVVVEELAHIVHAAVEEMAEQERNRPEPPPPPEDPPKPPRDEGAGWGFDAGALAGSRMFGTGALFVVGGGVTVGVASSRGPFRPELWLSGTFHVPYEVKGSMVDVRLSALALRVAPTVRLFGGSNWLVEAGPEAGVDVLWSSPRSSTVPVSKLQADRVDASPVVGALVGGRVGVAKVADVFLQLALDADLAPQRYVVHVGKGTEGVFESFRLRPSLSLGFAFNLVGSSPYAHREERR